MRIQLSAIELADDEHFIIPANGIDLHSGQSSIIVDAADFASMLATQTETQLRAEIERLQKQLDTLKPSEDNPNVAPTHGAATQTAQLPLSGSPKTPG